MSAKNQGAFTSSSGPPAVGGGQWPLFSRRVPCPSFGGWFGRGFYVYIYIIYRTPLICRTWIYLNCFFLSVGYCWFEGPSGIFAIADRSLTCVKTFSPYFCLRVSLDVLRFARKCKTNVLNQETKQTVVRIKNQHKGRQVDDKDDIYIYIFFFLHTCIYISHQKHSTKRLWDFILHLFRFRIRQLGGQGWRQRTSVARRKAKAVCKSYIKWDMKSSQASGFFSIWKEFWWPQRLETLIKR